MTKPCGSEPGPSADVPLSDLQDAILDRDTYRQLLFDIETQARLIELRVKGGATTPAGAEVKDLAEACALLENGKALGIQLRYEWRGRQWWDTLFRTPHGMRLVRIQRTP